MIVTIGCHEEDHLIDVAEWLGSGCCEPELWEINGAHCRTCEWYHGCSEGQYMVENPV